MTPAPVAAFMATMFDPGGEHVRLLDAGAGVGSLTAAFVAEQCRRPRRPDSIEASAVEFEPAMLPYLRSVLRGCSREARAAGMRFVGQVAETDFIEWAVRQLDSGLFGGGGKALFNAAILNPPYRKIHSSSRERSLLRAAGIETSNLYTAFVALTVRLLEPGGELVAITPRSFCNGPYFKPFRQLLLREMALLRVHVFETRNRAFQDDDVLQENVIFHTRKGARRGKVVLSTSAAPDSEVRSRTVPHDEVVSPADPDVFIHLALSESDARVATAMQALPCTLQDLGIQVSTGRVVDFRAREFLRKDPGPSTVPLIYPAHFERGFVAWPRLGGRKPNALADVAVTADLMVPGGTYVLTKRFTSKEERRRVVAAVYDPKRLPDPNSRVGFENHVNYFHSLGKGLPKVVARGLAAYLNSSLVDAFFRQFNGHTQVNAADLRGLRYPSLDELRALGRRINGHFPDQEGVDGIVEGVLPSVPKVSAR
jgi:adenine-specific DNA-methyltransferase